MAIAWLLAFIYCHGRYWRDPHSAFFQSETVYEQRYSKYRALQAQAFIEHATTATKLGKVGEGDTGDMCSVCNG
jgi:hypothetical protein